MSRMFSTLRREVWLRVIGALLVTALALTSRAPVLGDVRPADAAPVAPAVGAWTPPSPSYRVTLTADGLYALDYTYLSNAGLPVDSIDPRRFRMFYMGEEIAIRVLGEEDGVFGPGDAVLFYGRGVDSLFYDGLLPTNKYTGASVFWLSYGGSNGRPMAERDGSGAGTTPASFPHRERLGRNYWYFSAYPFEHDADHWYDNWIRPSGIGIATSRSYSFIASNVDSGATPGTLKVDLLGYRPGQHYLRLYVNNNLLLDGSPTWDDFETYTVQVNVPQAYFVNGTNTVKFEAYIDPAWITKTADEVYVNWADIIYNDTFIAESNVLAFRNLDAGSWRYDLSNFGSADIEVYDVTDMGDVQRFVGTTISGSGPHSVSFGDSSTGARRYLALNASAQLTPTSITAVTYPTSSYSPADLLSTTNGANYVIISHNNFWVDAGRLVDWRAADFSVALVDVQQIYDQFNGGMMSAEAIRDFLAYAYANWSVPPEYVVLLGDGSSDIRNYRYSTPTYIPPYLYLADPDLGETAADNRFVTITGNDRVPEMHLGRLPANSADQAKAMVDKIIAYEDTNQCRCDGWNSNTLFVADDLEGGGGDFYAYSDEVAEGYVDPPADTLKFVPDPPYTVTKAYLGRTCDVLNNPSPATECQNLITSTLENTGALFVSFVGHAEKPEWGGESLMNSGLLSTVDNGPCLPVAFPMTCLEGSYHDPTTTALAEAAVRMPVNGFIASWSPTGLGLVTGHDYLEKGVVLALLHENIERLGPATTYGKQYLEDNAPAGAYRDLLDTFGLIGDPGLQVKTDYVCSLIPLAVVLGRFEANQASEGVRVAWETADESEILGFNILRGDAPAGEFLAINQELILADHPGIPLGQGYSYVDDTVRFGRAYTYKLEIVKLDGTIEVLGLAETGRIGLQFNPPQVDR